VYKLLFCTFI